MSPLCFFEAVILRANNEITEDEYLEAIVDHCTGIRHRCNQACKNDTTDPGAYIIKIGNNIKDDRFASSIAYWIYYTFDRTPVEGMQPDFF